ncbi:hypothetical protein JQK19_14740 [Chromobacterium violaceum]|uniref:DUF6932 family protein n=1 Tax=Chromobacterium violaceum TaxID=536 RepID=UPI001BE9710B|nr:hypothetical protein [Chromobacterium violaceum]MBT2868498.1 hypothetical protein [Chromobacterium violaceum]
MIPTFNASLVLPPYMGETPTARAAMSPYKVTMLDVVERFATNEQRVNILCGLLQYREALRNSGLTSGFQWLDGSFVEDVENIRKRPPKDIDIVTFSAVPGATNQDKRTWLNSHIDLIDPKKTKETYKCDAYLVDLSKEPNLIVDDTRYWFGLFSHQRETTLWKGMIQVPLWSNDDLAMENLGEDWPNKGENNA